MKTMKRVREDVQKLEVKSSFLPETSFQASDELKPAINNLLHLYLPGHVTITQCEVLCRVIYSMIEAPELYLNTSETNG